MLVASRLVVVVAVLLVVLTVLGAPFKTSLWDWLELLIVPAVIAGGGLWFNQQQRNRELKIAEQRAQDEAFEAYLDQISQLLIDREQPLRKARPEDGPGMVARARTFSVLARLDTTRQRRVLQFLKESGLIERDKSIVSLKGADLTGADLRGAHLLGVNLRGANLAGADLSGANLDGTDLCGAGLTGADLYKASLQRAALTGAGLTGARLVKADLAGADLRWTTFGTGVYGVKPAGEAEHAGADLTGASLKGADLSGADATETNLRDADFDEAEFDKTYFSGADLTGAKEVTGEDLMLSGCTCVGTTLPNGLKFEEWAKQVTTKPDDDHQGNSST